MASSLGRRRLGDVSNALEDTGNRSEDTGDLSAHGPPKRPKTPQTLLSEPGEHDLFHLLDNKTRGHAKDDAKVVSRHGKRKDEGGGRASPAKASKTSRESRTRAQTAQMKPKPGVVQHNWEGNPKVWVKVYGRGWVEGTVSEFIKNYVDSDGVTHKYAIRVQVELDGQVVYPVTWKAGYSGPVPFPMIHGHVRRIDDLPDCFDDDEERQMRVLKHNKRVGELTRNKLSSDTGIWSGDNTQMDTDVEAAEKEMPSQPLSGIDQVLFDDEAVGLNLKDQLLSLKNSREAADVFGTALGSSFRSTSITHTLGLAYILGQWAGCQLQALGTEQFSSGELESE